MKRLAALLCSVLVATACGEKPDTPVELLALPELDLSRFEPGLARRLSNTYTTLNRATGEPDTDTGDRWLQAGMVFQAHGIEDVAALCYTNAQRLGAGFGAVYLAAYLQQRSGNLDAALAGYQDASALEPVAVAPLLRLGEIYLQKGDMTQAADAYGQVLSHNPDSAAAHSGLGRVALGMQDYARARLHLERALALQPDADQLHYPLGQAFRGLGDLEHARTHLAQRGRRQAYIPDPWLACVQAQKSTSQSHIKAGLAAFESGDLETAATEYRAALASQPDLGDTHLALAWVLEQLAQFDAAATHTQTAIGLNPDEAKGWHQQGRLLDRAGDDSGAANAYRKALELAPGTLPTLELLADTLMRRGNYAEALGHYDARLSQGEATPRLLYLQGLALVAAGRCTDAYAAFATARANSPGSAEAAEALIRVGSSCATGQAGKSDTVTLATQLFQALPEAPFAEALAMAFAADGQFDKALALQQRVVDSGKGNAYSVELLQRFKKRTHASQPWPADTPRYAIPRLGQ